MNGWLVRHVERNRKTRMRMVAFLEPLTQVISQRQETVAGARAWTAEN